MHLWIPPGRCPEGFEPLWPIGWELMPVEVWRGEGPPPAVQVAIAAGVTFVAHNAEVFDSQAWERFVPGVQPQWYDTIHCVRAAGLPGSLDALGRVLCDRGKDGGKEAAKLLFTAKVRGGRLIYPVGTVEVWRAATAYNIADVLLLQRVFASTTPQEPEVLRVNQDINERGCPIDRRLARVLRDLWTQYQNAAKESINELTDCELSGDDARSTKKVKAWLATQGLNVVSLERKQIEQMIADPEGWFGDRDDPAVVKVMEVIARRQEASRAVVGKIDRVFAVADSDDRVRNMFVYHGAHTGRWSGRDLQPHNMPRGCKMDVEGLLGIYHETGGFTLADVEAALRTKASVGDGLATMFRPIIRASKGRRFLIFDYAGVEARGVAWAAREQSLLDLFLDPTKDVYLDTASKIYGEEVKAGDARRQVGKTVVLGCGYQMGVNKFEMTCRLSGVDLAAAGTTADACVKAYRHGYQCITRQWKQYDRVVRAIVGGEARVLRTGRCTFSMDSGTLVITLPSGRDLRYRSARVEMLAPRWAPHGELRPTICYESNMGFTKYLYGGLVMENVVQGFCRDFLADALLRVPYPAVLHVHDEGVWEVEDDSVIEEVGLIVSTPPAWAADFPLRVEGFSNEHYTKGAFKTSRRVDAMRGRIL